MSALAELERLQEAVGAQRARVAELDRARSTGARRVEEARERLLAFYRERELRAAGREFEMGEAIVVEYPDLADRNVADGDVAEAVLIEDLHQAQGGLQLRASVIPYGGGMQDVELESVDPRAEAMHQGAVQALAEREEELRVFVRARIGDLAAERAPMARAVRDRVAQVLEDARRAAGAHELERSWWARTLSAGGMEELLSDMPENALRWATMEPGEAALPLPARFT